MAFLFYQSINAICKIKSCLGTGNMQVPYNSPGVYLVHVLFPQFVFFPISGPGRTSGKTRYYFSVQIIHLCQCFPTFFGGGRIPNQPKSFRTQSATMKATSHRVWLLDNVTSLNRNLSEEATKQTR